MTHRKYLKKKKRIVVKVGTSTLAYENGKINLQRMEKLAMYCPIFRTVERKLSWFHRELWVLVLE